PTRRDPDLRAEPQLAAVVKTRRCVDDDASGVDLAPPAVGVLATSRQDRLGMTRAVLSDVRERALEPVLYHAHGEHSVEELAAPVVCGRGTGLGDELTCPIAASQLAAGGKQRLRDRRKETGCVSPVDQEALESVASARTAHLRVEHDLRRKL